MIVPIDILSQLLFESINLFSFFKNFFGIFFGILNIRSPHSNSSYDTKGQTYA